MVLPFYLDFAWSVLLSILSIHVCASLFGASLVCHSNLAVSCRLTLMHLQQYVRFSDPMSHTNLLRVLAMTTLKNLVTPLASIYYILKFQSTMGMK